MKLIEALEFRRKIEKAAETMTDENALTSVELFPKWRENVSYAEGERVNYNDTLYKVLQAHTSQADWTPDVASSLFAKVLITNPSAIPEWEQPDSTNSYMIGDKVTYDGRTWISTVDNNVWQPSVYGWDEVTT